VHYILLFCFLQHFSTNSPWRGGFVKKTGNKEMKEGIMNKALGVALFFWGLREASPLAP